MAEGSNPDWAAIRAAVEAGEGTQAEIAARFGVKPKTLGMRKYRGRWMPRVSASDPAVLEAGLTRITRQMLSELKRIVRKATANHAAAKKMAEAPAPDEAALAERLALQGKAEASLERILKMTAAFTRLVDRAVKASADERAAYEEDERSLVEFEREILAHFGFALSGGALVALEQGSEAPLETDLAVPPA